jgi:hypothetical protein
MRRPREGAGKPSAATESGIGVIGKPAAKTRRMQSQIQILCGLNPFKSKGAGLTARNHRTAPFAPPETVFGVLKTA